MGKRKRVRPPSMWLTQLIYQPLRVTRSVTGLNQLRQCSVLSPHTAERALCGASLSAGFDAGDLILATALEFHKFPGELRTNFDFGEFRPVHIADQRCDGDFMKTATGNPPHRGLHRTKNNVRPDCRFFSRLVKPQGEWPM